jgi:hypothetical protein
METIKEKKAEGFSFKILKDGNSFHVAISRNKFAANLKRFSNLKSAEKFLSLVLSF